MKVKAKNCTMIAFEEMLREFRFDDNNLSLVEQMQEIIDQTDAECISIGDKVIRAEELINKITIIESTLLKIWRKFDLPQFTL